MSGQATIEYIGVLVFFCLVVGVVVAAVPELGSALAEIVNESVGDILHG
jgi:hypothetical protein